MRSTCANPTHRSQPHGRDRHQGGPGVGFLQYKQFDFLTDKEVVLTYDDGPWPTTTAVEGAFG